MVQFVDYLSGKVVLCVYFLTVDLQIVLFNTTVLLTLILHVVAIRLKLSFNIYGLTTSTFIANASLKHKYTVYCI